MSLFCDCCYCRIYINPSSLICVIGSSHFAVPCACACACSSGCCNYFHRPHLSPPTIVALTLSLFTYLLDEEAPLGASYQALTVISHGLYERGYSILSFEQERKKREEKKEKLPTLARRTSYTWNVAVLQFTTHSPLINPP